MRQVVQLGCGGADLAAALMAALCAVSAVWPMASVMRVIDAAVCCKLPAWVSVRWPTFKLP